MSDPQHQMIVLEPRRRGRPRARIERVTVSAWIPATAYDRMTKIAHEKDVTMSALVGEVLVKTFVGDKP